MTQMVKQSYDTKALDVGHTTKTDKRKDKTKIRELGEIMTKWSEVNDEVDN